jgi:selenocysteine-specific elongation factor
MWGPIPVPDRDSEQSVTSDGRPSSVVIGTAGHIDHGKTALIRALTGIDTDRLPEEKRRGITVDLGFASLNAVAQDKSPIQISFIDVPGHALFVRNMLAGAGGIDAVMLVISAEEGVKPQTEEHLAICTLLGIEHGLTVITKTDAVSEAWLKDVRRDVEQFLSGTFLRADRAAIVPVSAHAGTGMEELRHALVALAMSQQLRAMDAGVRLPLDRAFAMKGFGTVVTGTLITGVLKTGQAVGIEPGARNARIRGIQVHGHAVDSVYAGTRVAVNLAGIDVAEVHRGDTLVETSTFAAVDAIDVEITMLPKASPLKHRARVHFHAFTAECMASVSLYEYEAVNPGSTRLARLKLSKPVTLLPGDRFVLRHGSPMTTVGGGRVLDAYPMPRVKREACRAWLEGMKNASREKQWAMRVDRRGIAGLSIASLSRETGIREDIVGKTLVPMIGSGELIGSGDLLLSPEAFDTAVLQVSREFERITKERAGPAIKRSELKSRTGLGTEVLELSLSRLEKDEKLRIQDELIAPFRRNDAASNPDRIRLTEIASAFEHAGLAAPSPEELSAKLGLAPQEMRRLMTVLLREKTLIRLGDDSLCVHQGALVELTRRVRVLKGQELDVAAFKQLAGVSRKYAIPLLEYFDRERITRKQGDRRIVL